MELNEAIHFVELVAPLVESGRFGVQVENRPTTRLQMRKLKELLTLAQKHRARTRLDACTAGVLVRFGARPSGSLKRDGAFLTVHSHANDTSREKVVLMLAIVLLLVALLNALRR